MNFDIKTISNDFELLNSKQFYRKYIADNSNWYFSEYPGRKYDTPEKSLRVLRTIVSETTGVSYRSVHMVGSAKIGCSLSLKEPFRPFKDSSEKGGKTSDIDIVVVSLRIFSQFWHRLHDEQTLRSIGFYRKRIIPSIFSGYIDGGALRKLDRIANEWKQLFSHTLRQLQKEQMIIHPINFRVYRCWEDFERYHLIGIDRLKIKIEGKGGIDKL